MNASDSAFVRAQLEAWLTANWDPDLTVRAWWSRLAEANLASPALPVDAGGRGWSREDAVVLPQLTRAMGILGPPVGLGLLLAAPTLVTHGTADQAARLVPRILDGRDGWCQLFSEPGAGSDLAGLQTRAVRDGEGWAITGQKVWTSGAQHADRGMLLARTNPNAPKHRGITYFAFDMHQPGVEIRPLREMTGRALFNEVFFTGARVSLDEVVGDIDGGWKAAQTTLAFERSGLGSGADFSGATPGSVAGHLDRRAGDFVVDGDHAVTEAGRLDRARVAELIELARRRGRSADPVVRQALASLYTGVDVNGWLLRRAGASPGAGNLAKLGMSSLYREARAVGNLLIGSDGMLSAEASATGGYVQELTIFSPAHSIYGGSDQVQRNIIGERVLGLPREPGPSTVTPFRDLPQNPTRF